MIVGVAMIMIVITMGVFIMAVRHLSLLCRVCVPSAAHEVLKMFASAVGLNEADSLCPSIAE